ncbi:hypothetical protein ABID65_009273 [Bradyrhizobium sp. S3.9.2]|uniref:hypothetical protein n=1 Tax=Bradyrhizobium sp. S3.9.2 TaxID=3156432 RepID=UPI00339595FE
MTVPKLLTYIIGFRKRSNVAVLATEVPTANQALAVIATVEQSVGKLDFIRSPQEGDIGAPAHALTTSAWLRVPLVISASISRPSFLLMFSRSS